MEKQQLLRDAAIEPTSEIIAQGLGAANQTYTMFMERLPSHGIELEWRYYNDGKAWLGKGLYKWTTSRGTPKEKNTFWLSIWDGFFKVGIMLPEKARAEALALPLHHEVRTMIEKAAQLGKLKLFSVGFDLCSDDLLDDIDTLIDFRKMLK